MTDGEKKDTIFRFDIFELKPDERLLTREGEIVHLTPRVFDLLQVLVVRAGTVVTKEEIFERVWGGKAVEEGNINRTVSTLRRQMGRQSNGNDFIETVPTVGYRFLGKVTSSMDQAADQHGPERASGKERQLSLKVVAIGAFVLTAILALAAFSFLRKTSADKTRTTRKNELVRISISDVNESMPEFSADRKRIRFFRDDGSGSSSFVMNADGSSVQRDESIPGLRMGFWSPDGSRVIYFKEGDTKTKYLAASDGSGETRFPEITGNLAWSPDSKKIVYQRGEKRADGGMNSNLYIYNCDDGRVDTIEETSFFEGDPSFSPDGNSILFVSDRDGNLEIYSKDLSTGETTRLTHDPAHDSFPSYSPDGTQIAFNSSRGREDMDVYIMNADGSGVKKITDLPSEEGVRSGCWSSDGTQILLTSDASGKDNIYLMNIEPFSPKLLIEDGSDSILTGVPLPGSDSYVVLIGTGRETSELWLCGANGKQLRKITELQMGETRVGVSPDGSRLVFTDRVDGSSEIFTIKIDGSERKNISRHADSDTVPTWSPDGSRIFFTSNRGENRGAFGIYEMERNGENVKMLYYANSFAANPVIAPDGSVIYFSDDKVGGRTGNFEIFSMPVTGGDEPNRLTFRRKSDGVAAVSPDGRKIAFISDLDGNTEIYIMNTDGSGVLRLTRDLADDKWPVFSNDGKRLLFSSNRDGKFALYEIALD